VSSGLNGSGPRQLGRHSPLINRFE